VQRLSILILGFLWLSSLARAESKAPPVLSRPPRLVHFEQAVLPDELATLKHVDVILDIDIDELGAVQRVTVAKPGGEAFDQAAIAAAKQFVFEPGEYEGKPVPVRVTYRYAFLYKEPEPEPEATTATGSAPVPAPPPVATVPFSGRVLARGDRTPLANVLVVLDEDALQTVTDAEGRFSLPAVPVGEHLVRLRGPGIAASDAKLTLTAGKSADTTYYVNSTNRYSSTVRSQKAIAETVEQTLSGEELRKIPGTQGDTLKAVQNLPGVARAPVDGGQIVVWGSAPNDTRTYVDGVYIPTLFHFFGLRSTISSEMVSSLSFSPGGYSVEHGRGLGGVIDVNSRAPREDGFHGFLQIDPIDASLMLEGKLSKNVSFAVAARRSLLDTWLPALTPAQFQLTPTYYDYQARLHWRASSKDEVDLFFFDSDDQVRLDAKRQPDPAAATAFDSHIFFHRGLLRYTRHIGRATLTITPSIGYDVPFDLQGQFGKIPVVIDVPTVAYSVRAALHLPVNHWLRFDGGIDFEGNRWDYSLVGSPIGAPREGDSPGLRRDTQTVSESATILVNNFAPYVSATFELFAKRLTITPEFRVELFDFAGYPGRPESYEHIYVAPEPRVQARLRITKWAAIKAAVGVYHQAPDPQLFSIKFGNPSVSPEFGLHYVLGADFDPTPTLHIETTGFYKDLRNLVVRGETATDPLFNNDGIGRVYGGELLIRQELWRNFFGWVSYTVSRSERQDHPDQPWRLFQYDQTHILTLVTSYKLPRGFQVGLRFRYVTGNPYTPVTGSYFDNKDGAYHATYGPLYSQRLDAFNQLDLRVDKTWTFDRWKLSMYLDIQNVYYHRNAENVQYNFDFSKSAPVEGLPILPALGIRGEL
jgi:TonB family protein